MKPILLIFTILLSLYGCNTTGDATQVAATLKLKVQLAESCGTVPVGGRCESTTSPTQIPLSIKRLPTQEVVGFVTPDSQGFALRALSAGTYRIELKEKNLNLFVSPLEISLASGETKQVTVTITALRQ
jgi:hypothetical protein